MGNTDIITTLAMRVTIVILVFFCGLVQITEQKKTWDMISDIAIYLADFEKSEALPAGILATVLGIADLQGIDREDLLVQIKEYLKYIRQTTFGTSKADIDAN